MKRFLFLLSLLLFLAFGSVFAFANDSESVEDIPDSLSFDISSIIESVPFDSASSFSFSSDAWNKLIEYNSITQVATIRFPDSASSKLTLDAQSFFDRVEKTPSDFFVFADLASNGRSVYVYFVDISSIEEVFAKIYTGGYLHFMPDIYVPVYRFSVSLTTGVITYPTSLLSLNTVSISRRLSETSILSGDYLNKLKFTSDYFVPVFDSMYPIKSFHIIRDSVPKQSLNIDYLYLDGSVASGSHSSILAVGSEFSIASPAVVGHTPSQLVVFGTMSESDLNFVVTYSPTPYKLSVDFLDDTGCSVSPSLQETVLYNSPYTFSCPVVIGYTPEYENISGVMPASDLSFAVSYTSNSYTLTVNYLKLDGTKAFDSVFHTVLCGDFYSIQSPVLNDFTSDIPVVSGIMPPNDFTVTVTYFPPKSPITIALEKSMDIFSLSLSANIIVIACACISAFCVFIILIICIRILRLYSSF